MRELCRVPDYAELEHGFRGKSRRPTRHSPEPFHRLFRKLSNRSPGL